MMEIVALAFGSLFSGVIGLLIIVVVVSHRRERQRIARLHAYSLDTGWHPFGPPVPGPVDAAARSSRTKLALARQSADQYVWAVWHKWTETSGGDSSSSRTRNLIRYYVWLGERYPPMEVVRRTSIGGLFKPVRGMGTGDAEFDKRFLVKPTDRAEPRALLTPAIRQALLAGQAWPWTITEGTLVQSFWDEPTGHTLQPRADGIAYLAHALTGMSGGTR